MYHICFRFLSSVFTCSLLSFFIFLCCIVFFMSFCSSSVSFFVFFHNQISLNFSNILKNFRNLFICRVLLVFIYFNSFICELHLNFIYVIFNFCSGMFVSIFMSQSVILRFVENYFDSKHKKFYPKISFLLIFIFICQ